MGGGCAWFDYNQDSLIDIYLAGGTVRDALFRNNGDGTFTNVTSSAGLDFTDSITTIGVTTGDIDNDGYREIFVLTMTSTPSILLKNNGDGTFTDITLSSGIAIDTSWGQGASFGDYNRDGYIDLYVGNYVDTVGFFQDSSIQNGSGFSHLCFRNTLFRNNGDNTFTDVTDIVGGGDTGCNLGVAFTDYDSDGDMDLYSVNDFGEWIIPNKLYRNEYPSNSFTEVSSGSNMDAEMYSMGIAIGDYDMDLDLDYYITNIGRNRLHQNNGDGTFTDTTDAAGVANQWIIPNSTQSTGWGTGFLDIDNDMYLDLFVSNGFIGTEAYLLTAEDDPNALFYNNGDGTFTDIASSAGVDHLGIGRGFAFADYDNDGDNDLASIPIFPETDNDSFAIIIYRNDLSNSNNWLKVNLEGTISNRDAYGSQMIIYVGGKSWIHEVSGGASHASQHSTTTHFGLGSSLTVDSLVINWPNGMVETVYNIAANQTLWLIEGMNTNIRDLEAEPLSLNIFPNPASDKVFIRFDLPQSTTTQLTISNLLGQTVWQQSQKLLSGKNQLEWDCEHFSEGVYLIKLEVDGRLISRKIIVQK